MKLKIKIVALFAFIFIASYVPENYPTAFGDWKCQGSGKEISEKLFISSNTVETHRKNILKKLNAKNTISLVKFALKNNLIKP